MPPDPSNRRGEVGDEALHAFVQNLAADFELKNGRIAMEEERQLHWLEQIGTLRGAERSLVALHLNALARRMAREAGNDAVVAVVILISYSSLLMGSVLAAKAAVMDGMTKEMAQAIGVVMEDPQDAGVGEGVSALALRLGQFEFPEDE